MTKPVILLDCDGVLGDLMTPMCEMHNAECQVCQEPMTHDKIVSWDISRHVACGVDIFRYFTRLDLWSRPRPLPLARGAVKRLTAIARVVVVTSIASDLGPLVRAERIAWVRRYYPMIDPGDIVISDKKDSVSGDILVEDRTATLNTHPAEGICIAQPWNQDYLGTRVADWREAYERIVQYLS